MDDRIVQIRARGTLTLPAKIRERYSLEEGDPLTLIDIGGALMLVPRTGVVPKLAAEIERLRKDAGLSVEDMVAGVREERVKYYKERLEERP